MAHDLRTPLVTVISANENILSSYPDDPMLTNIMKLSNSSCYYLISIIEQITELSKIQLNTFTLSIKYFDFRESLKSLIDTMSIQSEFKGLEFSFVIDKNVPKKFLCDSKRIN
jgi:signal transduction histidine kinase